MAKPPSPPKPPTLPKFEVRKNAEKDRWELKKQGVDRPVRVVETKADMTKGGFLEKAVGKDGGSVRIAKQDGTYQEERTYPQGRDPKSEG